MIRFLIVLALAVLAPIALGLLSGCSTLNKYGIGGPPEQVCREGKDWIDDRVAGSYDMRVSFMRRFPDGDKSCKKPSPI